MRKIVACLLLCVACGPQSAPKPDHLLDESTMADIIYDLSVLEALKSNKTEYAGNATSDYIYKKYHIDSVQFAQNNLYYAEQIKKYQKIYADVADRLERDRKAADSLAGNTRTPLPDATAGIK